MRMAVLAAGLSLMAGAAAAQPAAPAAPPPIPLGPPRAFSGYSQPEVPPCRMVSDSQTQCTIPAGTMGRYLIEASGTSTWAAADAAQAMGIVVGVTPCGRAQDKAPWTKGPRTFRFACVATVLTDRPLNVFAVYQDTHATKDPRGPTVTFKPLPWDGVLGVTPFVPKQ
jgi:hypothetical protein